MDNIIYKSLKKKKYNEGNILNKRESGEELHSIFYN